MPAYALWTHILADVFVELKFAFFFSYSAVIHLSCVWTNTAFPLAHNLNWFQTCGWCCCLQHCDKMDLCCIAMLHRFSRLWFKNLSMCFRLELQFLKILWTVSLHNTRISAVSWLAVDALLYAGLSINGAESLWRTARSPYWEWWAESLLSVWILDRK